MKRKEDLSINIGGAVGNTIIRSFAGHLVGGIIIRDELDGAIISVVDNDIPALIKGLQQIQDIINKEGENDGD